MNKITCKEREALAHRTCNFYIDLLNKSCKTTINYFVKQDVQRKIINHVLANIFIHEYIKILSKANRPFEISNRNLNQLMKFINNRSGASQHNLKKFRGFFGKLYTDLQRRRYSIN